MPALAIGAAVSAAGSLGSAWLGGNAAEKAAKTQADAADRAGKLQGELGQEALGYDNYQYQQSRADQQPWLQSGANANSTLDYLLGLQQPKEGQNGPGQTLSIPGISGSTTIPGVQALNGTPNTAAGAQGSLLAGYGGGQFHAPTAAEAEASPGTQFQLQQGQKALESSAAANGSLLTGGTLNAEQQFGQGLAQQNYGNVYNQALQTYNTNYNAWANDQANKFNRLADVSGRGQVSAQHLGQLGMESANQVGNTLMGTGREVGQQYNNAAAATASGYVGQGNAWAGGLSNAANSLGQGLMLNSLMGQGGGYNGWGKGGAGGGPTNIPTNYNDPTEGMYF